MATEITIDDLSAEDIEQAEEFLATFISDEYPNMDVAKGTVYRQIVLRQNAIFRVADETELDRLRRSWSLYDIEQDPTLADDDTVDKVLSNYLVTRTEGTIATGSVAIVLNSLRSTTIPSGSLFAVEDKQFEADITYTGVTSASAVISEGDRLITQRSDGSYSFTINVDALEEGSESRLTKNTQLVMEDPPNNYVYSYAESDFTGGTNTETNEELMQRMRLGISSKTMAGRANILSLLQTEFPGITDAGIIGMGDAESIRDRHNIWSGSMGGKVDIYARSQDRPDSVVLSKTATLIDKTTQKWQLSLVRDDAPGFYVVESIKLPTALETFGGYEITSELRSIDMTDPGGGYIPDVLNITEGAYTRYQTAVVQFIDTDTSTVDLEVGDTQIYSVSVSRMQDVKDMQDYVEDYNRHNPAADYLVKAPVPCFVAVSIKILQSSSGTLDTDSMRSAIVDRVNQVAMGPGRLPASVIIEVCHDYLGPTDSLDLPIDMTGNIRHPDGVVTILRSGDALEVPTGYEENEVSGKTVAFYLEPDDVDIAVD